MLLWKRLYRWLRALLLKNRFEAELQEELRFHLDSMAEAKMRAGMSPGRARREALLDFGGEEPTKELCRDARVLSFLEQLWRDFSQSVRTLRQKPGYSGAIVLTLALGIAANTAVFSMVSALLLEPLPFAEPDRLVRIDGGRDFFDHRMAPGRLCSRNPEGHETLDVFHQAAGYDSFATNLHSDRSSERIRFLRVSADFFTMLGVGAWRGRLPDADEFKNGARVLVIGYALWRNHFASDPGVVGRLVRLGDEEFTIIGITAPEFRFHFWNGEAEGYSVILPRSMINISPAMDTIARLKPGVSVGQAQAQVDAIAQRAGSAANKPAARALKLTVTPLATVYQKDIRRALLILSGAVVCVLLIACLNAANLMLASGAARQREFAIRSAIGCSQLGLMRRQLAESLVLSLTGGALGLVLSAFMLQAVVPLIPVYVPRIYNVGINWRVLSFAIAASVLTAMATGLVPARKWGKPSLNEMLKQGGIGANVTVPARVHSVLIAGEIALALVLMTGSGLLIRSLANFMSIDLGFDSRNVLTVDVGPDALRGNPDLAKQAAYYHRLLDGVRAIPGVLHAAIADYLPLTTSSGLIRFHKVQAPFPGDRQGAMPGDPSKIDGSYRKTAGTDYFRALGIPLLAGRYFDDRDGPKSPCVLILDRAQAAALYPNENPVGRQLILEGKPQTSCEIVGVVENLRHWGISREPDPPLVYRPSAQVELREAKLIIRTSISPETIIPFLRASLYATDKNLPLHDIQTLEKYAASKYSRRTFPTILLSAFAAIALFLALFGVYSTTSYLARCRIREIGIRMTVGARLGDIVRLFLRYGARTAIVGILVGLGAAFLTMRLLVSLLFEVEATNPETFAAAGLVLLAAALAACLIPAYLAGRIDPMTVLRLE